MDIALVYTKPQQSYRADVWWLCHRLCYMVKGTREHDFTERLVLFKRRVTDKEVGPDGQRQLGAGAGERFLVLFRIFSGQVFP